MKTNTKLTLLAAAAVLAWALTGCGGGDDDEPVPVTVSDEVSDSAGSSTAAFVTYLLALTTGEGTSEPLTIKDSFSAPADETSEPTPLT